MRKPKISLEKIPSLIKRCPKCSNLSLEFDANAGRIYCSRCGFESYMKK